jgi:hypothetical protein
MKLFAAIGLMGCMMMGCMDGTIKKNATNPALEKEFTPIATIQTWQKEHTSNQAIYQQGVVTKLLQDDNEGSRHQKFIVMVDNQLTLLISHNIDLAPRIENLQHRDTVVFFGEYEWNRKGGVVHWTHKDPQGKHANGFLQHQGKRYE